MRRPKKSKYKSVVIKKKRYYYYKITWIDPTGDSGHANAHDSLGLIPSTMIKDHHHLAVESSPHLGGYLNKKCEKR